MFCYHHTDMDGKSAGWLVHSLKPETIEDHPLSYNMTNYGDKFDKHKENDDVFVVDISISDTSYDDFINLCKTARSVTWIDHHKTSLEIIEKHKDELQAIKNLTYFVSECACGAALVYSFLHIDRNQLMRIRQTNDDEYYDISAKYENATVKITMTKTNKKNPADTIIDYSESKLPKWLFHVDDYDCWKKVDPESEYFALAFDSMNTDIVEYNDKFGAIFNRNWHYITREGAGTVTEIIDKGQNIYEYIMTTYRRDIPSTFEFEMDGAKFICKNGRGNSWNFDDLIVEYDAAILFHYDGASGKWDYSVYSHNTSKFDCSAFCKKYGGGGHFHASGMQLTNLIFLDKPKDLSKKNMIFLGGTCNEDPWRKKFMSIWDKRKDEKTEGIELFNPVVENWDESCIAKEQDIKENRAKINLFVITPRQKGVYSFAEIIETSHYSKVYFAVYDEEDILDADTIKSYTAIGKLVEDRGGKFKVYKGLDTMEMIVSDVISEL